MDLSLNMSKQEVLIYTDVESVVDFDSDDSVMDFCIDSNEGSVAELEWNIWDEACTLDFQNASGAFPPVPAVVRPAVEFSDNFTSKEDGEKAVRDLRIARLSLSAHSHFGLTGNEHVFCSIVLTEALWCGGFNGTARGICGQSGTESSANR